MSATPYPVDRSHLGEIVLWPQGFAVTLDVRPSVNPVRCCAGHATPEEAKAHGFVRAVQLIEKKASADIEWWNAHPEATS